MPTSKAPKSSFWDWNTALNAVLYAPSAIACAAAVTMALSGAAWQSWIWAAYIGLLLFWIRRQDEKIEALERKLMIRDALRRALKKVDPETVERMEANLKVHLLEAGFKESELEDLGQGSKAAP
jgi:cobalamin biosynthesis protein CobD/CbiB